MNIKEIKKASKKTLSFHLFNSILVCFIITLLISNGYKFNTTKNLVSIDNQINNNVGRSIIDTNNLDAIDRFIKRTTTYEKLHKIVDYKPTRGVLSTFFNQISGAGSIVIGVLNASNQIFFNNNIPSMITLIISTVIYFLIYYFVQNIFIVGKNRYFLEHRKFQDTSIYKIFFIYKSQKVKNVAKIMFKKIFCNIMWYFTLVGGIIKHYEYSMIPYILAENPNASSKECFKLSRQMTYGYKIEIFKMDLSLILWYLLGYITLGLSNIFYFNPYKESIYAQIYMKLREKVYNDNKDVFNDKYLEGENIPGEYPPNLYNFTESKYKKWLNPSSYIEFNFLDLILLFLTFSIVGYVWEVLLDFLDYGIFINRGTMFGPWLPIYGFGGILIITYLQKFKDKPIILFITSFLLSGIIEYFTGWYLETFKHMKWWDYSGYFLNIKGRICLEGLLVFSFAGCIFTYFIVPHLSNIYSKINVNLKRIIVIVLLSLFFIDLVYSHFYPNMGRGITYEISYIYQKNVYLIKNVL